MSDAAPPPLPKPPPKPPKPSQLVLATLGLLLVIEIGLRVAYSISHERFEDRYEPLYPPHAYVRDFGGKQNYRFISLYTMDPERGRQEEFDIDRFGFRLDTQKLRFEDKSEHKRIWMLGGSTTQGLGLRANETIAAHLNAALKEKGSAWRVYNLGQGGYTSNQELLLFTELLAAGHKPDAVICYDGINEQPFPGDDSVDGVPGWEKRGPRASLANDVMGAETSGTVYALAISRMSRLDDLAASMRNRMSPAGAGLENWPVVARRYLSNVSVIRAVAQARGIPSWVFFQPVMGYEVHSKLRELSTKERDVLKPNMNASEHLRLEAVMAKELEDARAALGPSFVDLHEVFRGHDGETLYADPRHPNGEGAKLIAAAILQHLSGSGI